MAASDDRALVTGRESHQIYLREGKTKRWIPDLWTMQQEGLSPADLEILSEEDLAALDEQKPVPCHVPTPPLPDGCYIESETGLFHVENGELVRILNPGAHAFTEEDRDSAIFLPDSILRGFPISGRLS